MKVTVLFLLSSLLMGKDVEISMVENENNSIFSMFMSIKADDVPVEDILPKISKLTGYKIEVESEVYVGPGGTITLSASKIAAYDLLYLLNRHMAPPKNMELDMKSKVLVFQKK